MAAVPVERRRLVAATVLTVVGLATPLARGAAQGASTGTVTGRITEAEGGAAIANARVQAFSLAARTVAGSAVSNPDGRYRLPGLAAGRYAVTVSRIGYTMRRADTITVAAGQTVTLNATLREAPSQLNQVVTTASRGVPEKVLEAPASISVVNEEQIARAQSVTVADLVRNQPGVNATQGGLAQSNVVARGFNNAFSGSLLMLQDYRFAGVPSLRVNVPFLATGTNEDIDRVEVLLGPAAALYGPNSANGVVHVITKSPFNSPGTTVSVEGGGQSLLRSGVRHATRFNDKAAFKVSGEFFRATDFRFRDPAEPDTFPTSAPAGRRGQINRRDFDLERYTGEARLDLRPSAKSEAITTLGYTNLGNAIELTGANGASQIRNWTYTNLQQRFRYDRLFAQAFVNLSDAGNRSGTDLGGTYLLRSGQPIVDRSRVVVGQLQHGADIGRKQSFVYGADYIWTNPRTEGTTNGLNETDDNVTEYGAYVQSTTRLTPRWELLGAARVDRNDRISGTFFSPRAALSYKPSQTQNFRLTFNRAFQSPGNFQMFLDLIQAGTAFANIRATGVDPTTGIRFRRDCQTGVGGLCMRTTNVIPAAVGGPNRPTDANAAPFYPLFIGAANQNNALVTGIATGLQQGGVPAQQAQVIAGRIVQDLATQTPTGTQVGTVLRTFTGNPAAPFSGPVQPSFVRDESPLQPSFVNNYEAGYKGIIGNKLRVALDGWFQQRINFITPAQVYTPTVFVDPAQLGTFIAGRVAQTAVTNGVPQAAAQALAQSVATQIATGAAGVPLGNVVPDGRLYQRNDVIFSYRTVNETIDLWGSDLAVDYVVTPRTTIGGNFSYISTDAFPNVPGGNGEPLRLNAPRHKGSLFVGLQDPEGWGGEVRYRYANTFRVNSAVFLGTVPVQNFLDASVNYAFRINGKRLRWTLNGSNLLNNEVPTFIGTPAIGRLITTRVAYDF